MADPLNTIRLAMSPAAIGTPVAWRAVVSAIAELPTTRSDVVEGVLVQLLTFQGQLNLGGWGHMPHSQSPQDIIRTAAIERLWQISGTNHASVCQQLAAGPVSPIVKRLVAALFPAEGAAPPAQPDAPQ